MSNEQIVEDLRAAKEVLFERGWHQGDLYWDEGSVCLVGACGIAAGLDLGHWASMPYDAGTTDPYKLQTVDALSQQSGNDCWDFNDTAESFDDVIDLIDETIKRLEQP